MLFSSTRMFFTTTKANYGILVCIFAGTKVKFSKFFNLATVIHKIFIVRKLLGFQTVQKYIGNFVHVVSSLNASETFVECGKKFNTGMLHTNIFRAKFSLIAVMEVALC